MPLSELVDWGDSPEPSSSSSSSLSPLVEWGEPESEPDQGRLVDWNGTKVPYSRILAVAQRTGLAPGEIEFLGTPAGRFVANVQSTALGQIAYGFAGGVEDLATSALDLGSRAGILPFIDRQKLQRNKAARDRFDAFIAERSDIAQTLGPRASRITDSVSRSVGITSTAAIGGPMAVYAAFGGDVFDQSLNEAERRGKTGSDAIAYAGAQSAIELGTMYAFGLGARSLGLRTMEEGFAPVSRKTVQRFLANKGVKDKIATATTGAAGAALEAPEEALTEFFQQHHDRLTGFREDLDYELIADAAVGGLVGAGAVGSMSGLNKVMADSRPEIQSMIRGAAEADQKLNGMSANDVANATMLSDEEFKKEFELPADASKEYVDEYRARFNDRAAEDRLDKVVSEEVTGTDTTDAGIPVPEDRAGIDALSSFEITAESGGAETAAPPTAAAESGGTVSHADLDAYSKILGTDSYFNDSVADRMTLIAESRKLGIPGRALQISNQILDQRKAPSAVEEYGLGQAFYGRVKRRSDLNDQARIAIEVGDTTNAEMHAAEIERLESEMATIKNALDAGGSLWGQAGRARQFFIQQDFSPEGVVNRATAAQKKSLSEKQKKGFVDDANGLNKTNEELRKVEGKFTVEHAGELLKKAIENGDVKTESDLPSLYEKIQNLFKNGCET